MILQSGRASRPARLLEVTPGIEPGLLRDVGFAIRYLAGRSRHPDLSWLCQPEGLRDRPKGASA